MAISKKIKPIDTKNNTKIDAFFKPVPKGMTKRKLENDENSPCHDENRKKTPSPPNSQSLKKPLGVVKTGGLKAQTNHVRIPLSDKSPQKPLLTIAKKQKAVPQFAVLCDEDIQKGVEKASTPPKYDSQVDTQKTEDLNTQKTEDLNTQKTEDLNTEDLNTQKTEDTQKSKELDKTKELDTQLIPEAGSQWSSSSPIDIRDALDDFSSQEASSFEIFQDDEEEDIFTKTTDKKVEFGSIANEPFFFDNEDSKSTESHFFSDNEEQETNNFINENDDFSVFMNPELDLSVSTLEPKTLSEEPGSLSQIVMPLPNPRGNDLLEKLNLKKSKETEEEEEEEEEDDDGLPLF